MAERRPLSPDDARRKLSRTVLRAAKHQKEALFRAVTAKNGEEVERLMQQSPLMYERNEEVPTTLRIHPEIADKLPQDFFDDPTGWIEARPNIERPSEGITEKETIADFWDNPYDETKVKIVELPGTHLISKRLERRELDEVAIARRAFAAGIPTPEVVAEISHHGNTYAWFRRIDGWNANRYFLERVVPLRGLTVRDPRDANLDALQPLVQGSADWRSRFEALRDAQEADAAVKRRYYDIGFRVTEYLKEMHFPKGFSAFLLADLLRDQFADDCDKLIATMPDPLRQELLQLVAEAGVSARLLLFHKREPVFADAAEAFREAAEKLVDDVTGWTEIRQGMGDIQALCEVKGIPHKDFDRRNFVIAFDQDGNAPLRTADGRLQLSIIDWEQGR